MAPFDYNAQVQKCTKTYIMTGLELTRADEWKGLMTIAYTLFHTNNLFQTDFGDALMDEERAMLDKLSALAFSVVHKPFALVAVDSINEHIYKQRTA